jgi:2-polyprenyl-6-methoxyphenol hydroxylase-like FAD-dependent oxidoreductase
VSQPAGILVTGAGPAGLALALQAHDHGADVRIIDRRPEAYRPSRALIMHARTLEVLRPLGVTQALLDRADTAPAAALHLGGRVVRVGLAGLELPDTAFPHLTLIRQMDVEAVLARALADRGVRVERGTQLVGAREHPEGVRALLRARDKIDEALFGFVAGCDGPASTVRAQAGIGWPGRPYAVEVVLADAELDGDLPGGTAHVVAGPQGLLFVFRLGELATWRLLATRPASAGPLAFGQPGPPVPVAEIQALLEGTGLGTRITDLQWSTRVRLQHRVAERFRKGRLFLAGDAAHAYSPATGQGMNAAIQDAANLGWKLAFAARLPDDNAILLGSYDHERRPVARQVLAMTHLAFWGEASTSRVPSLLRGTLAPLAASLAPAVLRRRRLVAEGIRLLSQLRVSYRGSPLSAEGTPRRRGGPRAGDRLPDATVLSAGRDIRLHELLARPGVHVLLDREADRLDTLPLGPLVNMHRLTSAPGRGLIAVRPDGYIGLRCQIAEADQLTAWLARIRARRPLGLHRTALSGSTASHRDARAGGGRVAHLPQGHAHPVGDELAPRNDLDDAAHVPAFRWQQGCQLLGRHTISHRARRMDDRPGVEADRGWWDGQEQRQQAAAPYWHGHRYLPAGCDMPCLPAIGGDDHVQPLPGTGIYHTARPRLTAGRDVADHRERGPGQRAPDLRAGRRGPRPAPCHRAPALPARCLLACVIDHGGSSPSPS